MKPIYLDYAATTPLDKRVGEVMHHCLSEDFGNPASLHSYGKQAKEKIEIAREKVANFIQAEPSEIIWTSGATEANNLAIKGAARLYQRKGKHIVTMKTEHKAVLDVCQHLEKEGFQVTYLLPESNGLIDAEKFRAALRDDTILVSIMQVNNETGIIQDIKKLAYITAERGILMHVDAAQSPGKTLLNVQACPVDLISFSAHKVYGPKGIGALYLRKKPRVRVEPLLHGGGHEQGMRSGTLATHQIVGMGCAFELAEDEFSEESKKIISLRAQLTAGLKKIPNIKFNTDSHYSVPNIVSIRFEGMLAEAILAQLPNIATSTASACQGKGTEGSYVLRAMGFTDEQAKSSVRFSMGRFTTSDEITTVLSDLQQLF